MITVISIIKNTSKNTYHPIVFCENPMPGPIDNQPVLRLKSKMHHTDGFNTKEDAIKNINDDLINRVNDTFFEPPIIDLESEMSWDGNGIPATVAYLIISLRRILII